MLKEAVFDTGGREFILNFYLSKNLEFLVDLNKDLEYYIYPMEAVVSFHNNVMLTARKVISNTKFSLDMRNAMLADHEKLLNLFKIILLDTIVEYPIYVNSDREVVVLGFFIRDEEIYIRLALPDENL